MSRALPEQDLDGLVEDIIVFQRKNFPNSSINAASCHLVEELVEVLASNSKDDSEFINSFWTVTDTMIEKREKMRDKETDRNLGEEVADLFFLVVQIADCAGVRLADVVGKKLQKNLARTWQAPDKNGVVRHERDS